MPESEHGNTETSAQSRTSTQSANNSTENINRTRTGYDAVIDHISNHKIDLILAITRALTVLCTISYLIGFPAPASNRYKQALLMNAATSSLRLHQRMPPPSLSQLNIAYFKNLLREDSFHYLIFPFMFFTGSPLTLTLLPCALYAIFNLAVYSITLLDKMGTPASMVMRSKVSDFVTRYQQSLLHTVALSEIALMPITIIGVFTKTVGALVPLLYCRFILLRYDSTRNAHLKLLVSRIYSIVSSQASRYMRR